MTPAINILKKANYKYKIHKYEHDPLCTNYGKEAAQKLGLDENRVFKTLVVELNPKSLVVAIIPVSFSLSLKKVALIFGAKNAKMANKQEVQKVTGYILGGVSPLGQKKRLQTIIDKSANDFDTIFVSGGKRGLDIELEASILVKILNAKIDEISL